MTPTNHTYNHIVHGSLFSLTENNEDLLRQLLNLGLRKNANNISAFFLSMIELFKRFNISTELENIEEWKEFSSLPSNVPSNYLTINLPPFTNKTGEFIHWLIKNTLIAKFTALDIALKPLDNTTDRTYILYQSLRPIIPLLNDISTKGIKTKNGIYTKDLLNITLFNYYFEVLKFNIECLEFETISTDEALYIIDSEYLENLKKQNSVVSMLSAYLESKTNPPVTKQIEIQIPKESLKPTFVLKKTDFRTGYKGKFDYETIDKKALFERVEEFLFEYDFIDADYNFTNQHNKQKELAAIFKLLINKGFFKKRNLNHGRKDFEPFEYRQYLDNRYGVNTSQEFSRCTDNDMQKVKQKYSFIDKL
jgi:hypothetical protein